MYQVDLSKKYSIIAIDFDIKWGKGYKTNKKTGHFALYTSDYKLARWYTKNAIKHCKKRITRAYMTKLDGNSLFDSEMRRNAGVPEFLC